MGRWFYRKTDELATWATKKLNIKILKDENNWKTKYPNVSNKMDELEARIQEMEDRYLRNLDDGK